MADFLLPSIFNMSSSTTFDERLSPVVYTQREEIVERSSVDHKYKRIMFIGKSGIGKSTLLNLFFHSTSNLDLAVDPAKTSGKSSGETDGIACYPNFKQERIYIDTVGLTDNRFKHEEILSAIRSFIRGIVHGLNVILIGINYGRIDADERRTLDMMEVIFGPMIFSNAIIVTFNSPMEIVTRQEWEATLDENVLKLANCKQVLFVNNTKGTNDIPICKQLRENVLEDFEKIMQNDSDQLYKPADGFLERVYDFFQLLFPTILVPDYQKIFFEMWKEIEKDCSICLCSIKKDQQKVLPCDHIFHENCINSWHKHQRQKNCPNCRQEQKEQKEQ